MNWQFNKSEKPTQKINFSPTDQKFVSGDELLTIKYFISVIAAHLEFQLRRFMSHPVKFVSGTLL